MEQEQNDDNIIQKLKQNNQQLIESIKHMNKVEKLKEEQKQLQINNEQLKEEQKKQSQTQEPELEYTFDRNIIRSENINTYKVQIQF